MPIEYSQARASVLAAAPYSGGRLAAPATEPSESDTLQALLEVQPEERFNADDLKVSAYAFYQGIENDRCIAPAALVIAALKTVLGQIALIEEDDSVLAHAFAESRFYSFGHNRPREVGWAIACVAMVGSVSPDALVALAGTSDDPAHIIEAFVLSEYLPEPQLSAVLRALFRSSEPLSILCAAELAWRAMSSGTIEEANQFLSIMAEADASAGVVAFASILDHLVARDVRRKLSGFPNSVIPEEIIARFLEIGAHVTKSASDIRRIIDRSGRRSVYVLGMLADRWHDAPLRPAAKNELQRLGFGLYTNVFRETLGQSQKTIDEPHVSYSMVEPLVAILSDMNFSVEQFELRFDRLACDRIARDTCFSTWLLDQRRARLLLIVCARVARANQEPDEKFISSIDQRAQWLATQPKMDFPLDSALVEAFEAIRKPATPVVNELSPSQFDTGARKRFKARAFVLLAIMAIGLVELLFGISRALGDFENCSGVLTCTLMWNTRIESIGGLAFTFLLLAIPLVAMVKVVNKDAFGRVMLGGAEMVVIENLPWSRAETKNTLEIHIANASVYRRLLGEDASVNARRVNHEIRSAALDLATRLKSGEFPQCTSIVALSADAALTRRLEEAGFEEIPLTPGWRVRGIVASLFGSAVVWLMKAYTKPNDPFSVLRFRPYLVKREKLISRILRC